MSLSAYEPMTEQAASLLNMLQLAYLGDSVWEVLVRNELLRQGKNVHHMHNSCIELVNAHAQAVFAEQILPELEDKEREILRRGRNAHTRHPVPRNQHPEDYSASTGFEALIGYLYLTGKEERLLQLSRMMIGGNANG